MNILLVSSYLPYPLFSGGHIRLFNLIKEVSKKHNITLICEKRDYQGESEIREVKKFCKKIITVPRRKQWSLGNILRAGFSLSSFLIVGHTSAQMQKKIRRELNENQFDLIHVETSYVTQNIPPTDIPVVLIEHNVEYLVYRRFAENAPFFMKPLLFLDVLKLKLWEENIWRKVSKLVSVSEGEKEIMKKFRKDIEVVSNGVDVTKFKILASLRSGQNSKFKGDGEKRILFIGEFKWIQNRDAIEWILKEIWPKLKADLIPSMSNSGVKLWIVGRRIPDSIRKLAVDKSVIFDDNAPKDTELIYAKSDLLLAPIRIGGGTSFKVLEAMASGVPVVTSPLGNAINAKENSEILVARTPDEFVNGIKKLLEDENFYKEISKNARKLVEEKFNWEKISNDLNAVYESVVSYA
ncbi:MAG: glycosyltransferase family 4 protein [Candidatus Levybacteria bacterium]|nr:glycosyltransferase family 4 protein [Candidatus Levybacteria bacterium]